MTWEVEEEEEEEEEAEDGKWRRGGWENSQYTHREAHANMPRGGSKKNSM